MSDVLILGKRILSIGHSSTLLRLRNAVLQQAGYQVTTTKESALVLELVKKQDFHAVVICSSVPAVLRGQIAHQVKRLKPSIPLIVICEGEECSAFKKLAEIVIAPPGVSEQSLIEAVTRVTTQTEEGRAISEATD